MGKVNIQRLKNKINIDDDKVDIYFEIIDRIYYECQNNIEKFNEETEVTTWNFSDGFEVSLSIEQIEILALFLLELSYDADENILTLYELEQSFLKEENQK